MHTPMEIVIVMLVFGALPIVAAVLLDEAPEDSRSYIRRIIFLIGTWRLRMRARRELALMSERSLRELGLTRYDALQEIRKPFWRG
jgi:uncharacterized protein YjiS (DUF1127 family)